MSKKTTLQLAKNQRSGTIVKQPYHDQLKTELLNHSSYQKAASKSDMKLKVLTRYIAGRRIKTVCIVYKDSQENNKTIPITAKKLYAPKKKRGCKKCGNTNCFKSRNIELMRSSIEPQIYAFREDINKRVDELRLIGNKRTGEQGKELRKLSTCPLSGKPLANKTHVDHIEPFIKLVDDWCSLSEVDICKYKLSSTDVKSWNNYHQSNAALQLTNAKANMKAGSKGY